MFGKMAVAINKYATLSAAYREEQGWCLGSRLTVYEKYHDWDVQLPLLLFTIIIGIDSILRDKWTSIFQGEAKYGQL